MTGTVEQAASAATITSSAAQRRGPPRPELRRGTVLGRYVVLTKLGAGGMGEVYAGYDPELDRKVALKRLHPQVDAIPGVAEDARARLLREAQALAMLNHPNIVTIHDVGEHRGAVWLAMEYIDGETVAAWLGRARRSWREVLAVMLPAARGLATAHEAGLVHRDIKPDNIMIGGDGRVRVMDLGLARRSGPRVPAQRERATAADRASEVAVATTVAAEGVDGRAVEVGPAFDSTLGVERGAGEVAPALASTRAVDGRAAEVGPAFDSTLPARAITSRPAFDSTLAAEGGPAAAASTRAAEASRSLRAPPYDAATLPDSSAEADVRVPFTATLPPAASDGHTEATDYAVTLASSHAEADARVPFAATLPPAASDGHTEATADAATLANSNAEADARVPFAATLPAAASDGDAEATADATALPAEKIASESVDDTAPAGALATTLLAAEVATVDRGSEAASRSRRRVDGGLTRDGAVLGTPPYMSPEQLRGDEVDARADVFAFSVSLWEALMGERPFAGDTLAELAQSIGAGRLRPTAPDAQARGVPRWLRRVCERGLAADPRRRYASMTELLAALSGGRRAARIRRWFAWALAALAVAATIFAVRAARRSARVAACTAAGDQLLDDWHADARARVREGLTATRLAYAPTIADKVMPTLDRRAESWRAQRTETCVRAEIDAALEPELYERAVWCLDERRMEFVALVRELSQADATVAERAVFAASGASPVATCAALEVLMALPPPPPPDDRAAIDAVRQTLSQGRALLLAGKYPEGLAVARQALADAEATAWPPVIAASKQLTGALLARAGDYAEAEAASLGAYLDAAKIRAWDIAAAAALGLIDVVGYRQARHAEGELWAAHAEIATAFAGDPTGLREADRLSALAVLAMAKGAFAEAKALHRRALAIREATLGADHPTVATSLNNLALVHKVAGEYDEAQALLERARAIWEGALGPAHPRLAIAYVNLARLHGITGAYADAKALSRRALAIWEGALGPDHPDVASALTTLANVAEVSGEHDEARALHARALAIRKAALGPTHPDVADSLAALAHVHSATASYDEARALLEEAITIREASLGRDHPDVAADLVDLADLLAKTGDRGDARALCERALTSLSAALDPEHVDIARGLAVRGRLLLADDRAAEALPDLERAVAIFAAHDGAQQGEVDARMGLARALVAATDERPRAVAEAQWAASQLRARVGVGVNVDVELAAVEAFLADLADLSAPASSGSPQPPQSSRKRPSE